MIVGVEKKSEGSATKTLFHIKLRDTPIGTITSYNGTLFEELQIFILSTHFLISLISFIP